MDAEWELVERSKSTNAMAPPPVSILATTLAELEAVKQEGNAYFQQRQLADAVQRYSFVVDCCTAKLASSSRGAISPMRDANERNAVAAVEIAVRLNRALANIERREFAAAEDDCAAVLRQQPMCVKALYRRALACEQLGKLEHARADLQAMLLLEPSNPAALELRTRLDVSTHVSTPYDGSALADTMHHCSLATHAAATTTDKVTASRIELAAAAEQAWRVLQDEELQMRRAIKSKQQVRAPKPAAVAPVRQPNHSSNNNQNEDATNTSSNKSVTKNSVFMSHTNDLWASLAQEEQRTVARVYATRRTRTSK